jgi:hypothetical protein
MMAVRILKMNRRRVVKACVAVRLHAGITVLHLAMSSLLEPLGLFGGPPGTSLGVQPFMTNLDDGLATTSSDVAANTSSWGRACP